MPFTLSHAAAVLPLRRTRLVWSALVLGSFGPDFQYFLFMSYDSRTWHSYPDVLRFCFPFTLAAFFLFQSVIRTPLAGLLPVSLQHRIDFSRSALPRTFGELLAVCVSLLIGIGTHLVWDSFTHPFSWFWYHFYFLRKPMAIPGDPRSYGYAAAQALSTVIGMIILAIAFVLWWRKTKPVYPATFRLSARAKIAIWAEILVLSTIGALWRANVIAGSVFIRSRREYFELIAFISGIGWFCWELLVYGLLFTYAVHRTRRERAHS